VGKESFANLSEDEIRQRLTNMESDRVALERALDQRRQQSKKDLAAEVRDLILDRGYDVAEIAGLLGGKKRGGARAKAARSYSRYVDPNNPENVYVRGVLPRWMKEQMTAKGLDPSDKADRETFKAEHLNRLDD
jgi:DNA-binding protein H-NS